MHAPAGASAGVQAPAVQHVGYAAGEKLRDCAKVPSVPAGHAVVRVSSSGLPLVQLGAGGGSTVTVTATFELVLQV